MSKSPTQWADGSHRIRYGAAELDETLEVRASYTRDGWVQIEDQATGASVLLPRHVAKALGRAVASFQRDQ